jgi:hypothetical protein
MTVNRKLRAPLLALICLAAVPAGAAARSVSGQALAAPTAGGSRLTLPVLLSPKSVSRNHLHSAVITLSLSKKATVATTAGAQTASTIGFGDHLSATVKVTKKAKKSPFPTLKASKVKLISHATTAQDAALAEKLAALTGQVNNLQTYVQQLASYVTTEFGVILGDIANDHATLTGLTSNLATLQSQLNGLSALLTSLNVPGLQTEVDTLTTNLSALTTTVGGLAGQIPGLVSGLSTVTTGLTNVEGLLNGINPGDLSQALTNIGALQTLTNGLDVASINSQLSSLASQIQGILGSLGNLNGTDVGTQLDNLSTTLTGLDTSLNSAVSRINVVCSASSGLLTGTFPLNLLAISQFPGC